MRTIENILRIIIMLAFTILICICGYELWKMSERYIHEEQVKNSVSQYSPAKAAALKENGTETAETSEVSVDETISAEKGNPFITELQNEKNGDIIGWITLPNTKIDYPFVTAKDNDYYLRRDLYGNYAVAGTIFMDYRCSPDFTDFNTVIYGHYMRNGSMFGDLGLFEDENFFDNNRFGMVFLKDNTYTFEIIAYMIIKSDDKIIYNSFGKSVSPAGRNEFFEYVKENARNYRELGEEVINNSVKIITLSTCSYEFNNARTVLIGVLNPNQEGGKP